MESKRQTDRTIDDKWRATDRQTDRTIDDKWRAKDRCYTINKKKVVINN